MNPCLVRPRWLIFLLPLVVVSQDDLEVASDVVHTMEAFNVTVYEGKIPIMDGFTGRKFDGDNQVVFDFATSFNTLLLKFHKKLVTDEIKHMNFRINLGKRFEQEMDALSRSFDLGEFALDKTLWLSRERNIVTRLINKPFFKINSLVAWDIDRLDDMAPAKPKSRFADDIHFNPELGKWERRVTATWEVLFWRNRNPNSVFMTDKKQGLNLDTLHGYHFIDYGLPSHPPPGAFKDVRLTYPIFYSDDSETEEELKRLQEIFIVNLYFIYDPFSWVARRDTRFRGGYILDCQEHFDSQRIQVSDRKWFNEVFPRFLSDVVTIKLQGAEEIYALRMLSKRIHESPRALGLGFDPLNWNKREKRQARNEPEAEGKVWINQTPGGMRYALIDAYQRHGDEMVDQVRSRLLAARESRKKINAQAMFTSVIEEMSGMDWKEFSQRAKMAQEVRMAEHRLTD